MEHCRAAMATTGGKASHLAVVCRGWGKPCVVGVDAISIDEKKKELIFQGKRHSEFTEVVISGNSGRLFFVGDVRSGYKSNRGYKDFVQELAAVVSKIMGSDKLLARSLEDQERVAEVIYLLREIEALP